MTRILLICCLSNLAVIAVQAVCNWSSWTSDIQCEWVNYHCMKGYHRHCLCNNIISQGSACSSNFQLTNYIETKPYVSNKNSVKGVCYKHDCLSHKNWCPWESWSYWIPVTNITCERHRYRKCCESQPKSGYTISLSYNYGCFISRSVKNSSDIEVQLKPMQCSKFTKWYYMTLYVGIAISCVFILCIICRFTSSASDKIKFISKPEEIQFEEVINSVLPTAPIDQPFIQPISNELIKESYNSTEGLPTTPPTYDESIGFNNFSTVPVIEKTERNSRKISRSNSFEELRGGPNIENIPPPSYALYLRNPILFNQTD